VDILVIALGVPAEVVPAVGRAQRAGMRRGWAAVVRMMVMPAVIVVVHGVPCARRLAPGLR
jgi:hypothetical protein